MDAKTGTLRIAHFSDTHFYRASPWRTRDYLSKRVTGWFNFNYLGRKQIFAEADQVASALRAELESTPFDHIAFSGDASCFGKDEEFEAAGAALPLGLPGLAVPGNHDYYSKASRTGGSFERVFAPWQTGQRLDDQTYPFAQKVRGFWLIGVASAIENRGFWDARGLVGPEQLDRFDRLCAQLEGPKILVTHYPYLLRKGKPEQKGRELRDVQELAELATKHRIIAWLHGHRHRSYWLTPTRKRPFAQLCAGSVTQHKRWIYFDCTFRADSIVILRRMYSPKRQRFLTADVIAIPLWNSDEAFYFDTESTKLLASSVAI